MSGILLAVRCLLLLLALHHQHSQLLLPLLSFREQQGTAKVYLNTTNGISEYMQDSNYQNPTISLSNISLAGIKTNYFKTYNIPIQYYHNKLRLQPQLTIPILPNPRPYTDMDCEALKLEHSSSK